MSEQPRPAVFVDLDLFGFRSVTRDRTRERELSSSRS